MDNTGITPVMPVGGNGIGDFGGGGLWIFALLILLMMGGGGLWGGNGGVNTLNADMQRGFDAQNMNMQTSSILSAVTDGTAQTIAASTANATGAINAIKDGNASLIREFGNVESALTALSGNMQSCCCEVKQTIMQSNYDAAMRDAATNANLTAQIQSVKDMISQNKIESLQAQISQLQLAQATAGMLKFPTSWSYEGGYFPPLAPTA